MRKPHSPLLSASNIRKILPKRPADSHKGKNGHVLVVAGSRGMSGAAVLTALGALRIGAGLVTVAIGENERGGVACHVPEALTLPLPETAEGTISERSLPLLAAYMKSRLITAVALGPGLSVHAAVAQVVRGILKHQDLPLVLDADGLNNITLDDLGNHPQMVITPHPGELARLLNKNPSPLASATESLADARHSRSGWTGEGAFKAEVRQRVSKQIAHDKHLICVLKGHHTIITDGEEIRISPTGNPAMATGGMGDVLTGVLAGLLAQRIPLFEAACAAVYLHGLAGDLARISDRGLLATEVAHALPHALRKIGIR